MKRFFFAAFVLLLVSCTQKPESVMYYRANYKGSNHMVTKDKDVIIDDDYIVKSGERYVYNEPGFIIHFVSPDKEYKVDISAIVDSLPYATFLGMGDTIVVRRSYNAVLIANGSIVDTLHTRYHNARYALSEIDTNTWILRNAKKEILDTISIDLADKGNRFQDIYLSWENVFFITEMPNNYGYFVYNIKDGRLTHRKLKKGNAIYYPSDNWIVEEIYQPNAVNDGSYYWIKGDEAIELGKKYDDSYPINEEYFCIVKGKRYRVFDQLGRHWDFHLDNDMIYKIHDIELK